MLEVKAQDGSVIFPVRVQPRASKDEIAGVMDGALKVRLRAPALEDRANEAAAVRILSGHHSRSKRVEVRGVTEQQVLALVTREA